MNKSQRIKLDINNVNIDKHIKVKLEQDVDTIEFLSMNINAKDVYRDFNADYGVLVGRVTANGGIGIPNARISVFIPLTDEDAGFGETYSIYPYKTPRDKNLSGKRYNLLPRVGKRDPVTGTISPKQPFGSLPIKEEIITNEPYLNIYGKYYKHTALTNNAGDYMIFGVPIGTQTIHLSIDITDIGEFSMTPAAMVTNLGYSPNLFTDNNTKIKPSIDLNDLPHIETQEISVDIIPFWGDAENFEIGITRQDFRVRSVLQNTFIIFGAAYTDGENSQWGDHYRDGMQIIEMYHISDDENENLGIVSKRIGKITESIYYYPSSLSDAQISGGTLDARTAMIKLSPTEYSSYKRDGDFVFIINCNRKKVMTSETGEKINVSDDYPGGVYTEFKGSLILEYTKDEVPMNWTLYLDTSGTNRGRLLPVRERYKFPQSATKAHSFRKEVDEQSVNDTQEWRRQYYTFEAGKLYSIAKFHGIVENRDDGEDDQNVVEGFLTGDYINTTVGAALGNLVGMIQTNDYGTTGNTIYEMPHNATGDASRRDIFVANWMNFSVYFPQMGNLVSHLNRVRYMRSNSHFSQNFKNDSSNHFYQDNAQPIIGGDFNTKWLARSDLNWTDFIEVPEEDIRTIISNIGGKKGFTSGDISGGLLGDYKNGQDPCPMNGGKINGNPAEIADPETYFFRGFAGSDCISYLIELGIVNE
jgi:hypothetical protein